MVIYQYIENHVPKEKVCGSLGEARGQAITDMDSGERYPKGIIQVVMDREAIQKAWENQLAA